MHEGKWLLIEKNFEKLIERKYKELKERVSSIELMDWDKNKYPDEGKYNEYLAEKNNWLLLDKKNIQFGTYLNRLELADLYPGDNQLIAVKKYHGASSISHLILQVKNSINAIRTNHKDIEKQIANKPDNFNLANINKFILAIATEDSIDDLLPKVAFFAKVSLSDFFENNNFGWNLEIKWIKLNKPL